MSYTAFQLNAFQVNAFQIGDEVIVSTMFVRKPINCILISDAAYKFRKEIRDLVPFVMKESTIASNGGKKSWGSSSFTTKTGTRGYD